MIKGIEVRGFRGIAEGVVDGFEQITLIIGRNGAGKSSILEVLYMISACARRWDDARNVEKLNYIVSRRGGRGSWDDARRILWYQGDTSKPIKISITLDGKRYEFEVYDEAISQIPVRLIYGDHLVYLEDGRASRKGEPLHYPNYTIELGGELSKLKEYLARVLLLDYNVARRIEEIELFAWRRIAPRRLDKLVLDMVREEFEHDAEGLTYLPITRDKFSLSVATSKTTVPLDALGDGARSAILASMLILASKPSITLIEEPELHMHPAGLYTLLKLIYRLAKEKRFQVIATTHSIETVKISEMLAKELSLGFTAVYVERDQNGVLESRMFSLEDSEILSKLGIDLRLLYKF